MRARRRFLTLALAAGLASVAGVGGVAGAAEVGDVVTLPAVQLLDGRMVPPSHWAGKPLVIEVWASWCPFCALQNPRLQALYDSTRKGGHPLQVLTISIDKEPKVAADYLKQRGYTFPATMDSPDLRKALGARKGLPELYVLDARGRVVQKELGEMLDEDVAALARYAK
ncbi:TlpA disulfide reductase family protein [Cupriavidus plantarum]|uniref:TlpA disulfide reductase family protein n=1 Tax=Cupriavidus plantarum TaxID=942865 RepID=UPI000EABA72C|nr:TlpA disulfide reductase family protein [Cupriavidus plantarum]NYH97272.1 thiol-disulfide isomerase/thioredoxin [Cupriavidus plantarum]RLK29167.1 thiol-disulfide isomerase/thioredoxin [Cupriavidus plantarum]